MTALYEKGSLPDCIGDQSPSPWDLTPWDSSMKQGQCCYTLPHASVTNFGAQVASQHDLILRTGRDIVSKLIRMTSKQLMKIKKRRLKTEFENWIKILRMIFPKLTLNYDKKLS